jgi:hypothetical protein
MCEARRLMEHPAGQDDAEAYHLMEHPAGQGQYPQLQVLKMSEHPRQHGVVHHAAKVLQAASETSPCMPVQRLPIPTDEPAVKHPQAQWEHGHQDTHHGLHVQHVSDDQLHAENDVLPVSATGSPHLSNSSLH